MDIDNDTVKRIVDFYDQKLLAGGTSPKGVDFNSPHSQEERFRQLLRVVDPPEPFSLLDYGCGYGELFRYLEKTNAPVLAYEGYDLTETMVAAARELFSTDRRATFTSSRAEVGPREYVVGSGLFNIRFKNDSVEWAQHIERTIDDMASLAERGFSFNMLTMYSDNDKMRADLYYGDPHYYFKYCRKFSRNVALIHDYDLYDFTIIVRKVVTPRIQAP